MSPLRRRHPSRAGRLVVLVAVAALTGCSGEQPTSPPAEGQPSSAAGHADLTAPPADADWNAADATYLSMMIVHHRQALDLADLVDERTDNGDVRSIASAIDAGQSREIIVMATWLADHRLPEPTLEDVETMNALAGSPEGMVGMLSPDQMTALAEADGPAFDRLFLAGMIAHHQGAIDMAEQLLGTGRDVRVTEMATEVIATQAGEIRRLDDLLRAT